MPATLTLTPPASLTSENEYFDDSPAFIQALQEIVLPGDSQPAPASPSRDEPIKTVHESIKRPHSPSPSPVLSQQCEDDDGRNNNSAIRSYTDNADIYGASRFGELGEYMRRKRAKLQIQNTRFESESSGVDENSWIFRGLAIYINGLTQPSVQDLRRMIVQYGGTFHAYLDRKSLVTHIITCSLTPAKVREFKNMKIVRPEWLVESITAGRLLPWSNYIFKPGKRVEVSQGVRAGQTSLLDSATTQVPLPSSNESISSIKTSIVPTSSEELEPPPCAQPQPLREPTSPSPQTPTPSQPITELKPKSPRQTFQNVHSPTKAVAADTNNTTIIQASTSSIPHYAEHDSNPLAAQAMARLEWRKAHTSVASNFIEGYYKNSRLHHLSTWKAELKDLVAQAQERAENSSFSVSDAIHQNTFDAAQGVSMRGGVPLPRSPSKKGKQKAAEEYPRLIMHCDFDCFFVSAGLTTRPELVGKPVVVCHSQGDQGGAASTSEIASASYEARAFGIKNGMSLQQARKLCPNIATIPYEFERYKELSLKFYTVLMTHADDLQAVSVDEALIDVTASIARLQQSDASSGSNTVSDHAKSFAETIRDQVREATRCEVSIGIGTNILLARLATRLAKPANSFHLTLDLLPSLITNMDIKDLHGFGWSAQQKAADKLGSTKLGELVKKSRGELCDVLGKTMGETLWNAIRGIDHKRLESDKMRKSVSCEINYGIRFENNIQAETFIFQLSKEVSRRLNEISMRGRHLTLKVMKRAADAPVEPPKFLGHGKCDTFNKQTPLNSLSGKAIADDQVIGEYAWRLLKSFNFNPRELRGLGIQIQKLESTSSPAIAEPGQAVLPFRPVDSHTSDDREMAGPSHLAEDHEVELIPAPPKNDVAATKNLGDELLPTMSQIDLSIFEALPVDIQQELHAEIKRRSESPAVHAVGQISRASSRQRSIEPIGAAVATLPAWPEKKITVKGTNVKRIAQQLAPRTRGAASPKKKSIFGDSSISGEGRRSLGQVNVTKEELRKLDIDPEVFSVLPVDMQREQLSMARALKAPGGPSVIVPTQRMVLKPYAPPKAPGTPIYRMPPAPQAKYLNPAILRQQGKEKGTKLYFTETDDVQGVIEAWVEAFRKRPPNTKDIDFFARWLTKCVDGGQSADSGVERAVAVFKWWLVLLRRHWGSYELGAQDDFAEYPLDEEDPDDVVARAWWTAFKEVKAKMNEVARRKFGGSLAIR